MIIHVCQEIDCLWWSREGVGWHTIRWGNRNSRCREVEEVTKGKGGEFVIGKGLLIVDLCPMNFDARFLLGCGALKKDGGREMIDS